MKILQRIANRFGLVTQSQFRSATANMQAALVSRLTGDWPTTTLSPDAQSKMDLKSVRARGRYARDNNLYGGKFIAMLKSDVLGDQGIHFRNKAKFPDIFSSGEIKPGNPKKFANAFIADKFYQWGRKGFCTVTGKLNWCDVQNICLETVATDGEILIRKINVKPEDGNPFGFTLQLLEAEFLYDDYDYIAPNGNQVRQGVELNEWGKPIAYHLRTYNPNDTMMPRFSNLKTYRIDASEIIHLGIHRRALSTRCMSWIAGAALQMHMVGKYEESETVSKRVAACKMGFMERDNANADYEGEEDADGNLQMEGEPGSLELLPKGIKAPVSPNWQHDGSSYAAFMKQALRGIAGALHCSYNMLADDMESVNFASGKLGLDFQRSIAKKIQYWFIESLCEEVFTPWLERSLSINALKPLQLSEFEVLNAPYFSGRRWEPIDPTKETNAKIAKLNAGLTSVTRILAEDNIDRDELFDEIAEDRKAAEDRDLHFDAVPIKPDAETEAEFSQQTESSKQTA